MPTSDVAPVMPDLDEWDGPLDCPMCGEEKVHLEAVGVHQDRALTTVRRVGTTHEESPTTSGRGSAVEVRFWCEDGCRFALRFSFRKGVTTIDTIDRGKVPVGGGPEELWRD